MTEIMGFHKRWITIEQAISRYDFGGIEALKRYCEAADAIVVTDDYTSIDFRISGFFCAPNI